jgi:hypothetical protein
MSGEHATRSALETGFLCQATPEHWVEQSKFQKPVCRAQTGLPKKSDYLENAAVALAVCTKVSKLATGVLRSTP